MLLEQINWTAIIFIAFGQLILGYVWYSPALFGNTWARLMKISDIDMEKFHEARKYKQIIAGLVNQIIMLLVLAIIINSFVPATFLQGALIGTMVWIGFMATATLPAVLWEKKPIRVYIIFAFWNFFAYAVGGGILTIWR